MFGFIDNILKFSTEVFKNQYTNNSFWLGLLLINIIITIALTLQYFMKPSKDKNGNPNTSKADSLKHLYYVNFRHCLFNYYKLYRLYTSHETREPKYYLSKNRVTFIS